jgi:hypothetical protein
VAAAVIGAPDLDQDLLLAGGGERGGVEFTCRCCPSSPAAAGAQQSHTNFTHVRKCDLESRFATKWTSRSIDQQMLKAMIFDLSFFLLMSSNQRNESRYNMGHKEFGCYTVGA